MQSGRKKGGNLLELSHVWASFTTHSTFVLDAGGELELELGLGFRYGFGTGVSPTKCSALQTPSLLLLGSSV